MKDDFLSHSDSAQLNRNTVLHYIRNREPASRTDIWSALKISRASVTQVIRQLLQMDLIMETGEIGQSGRRKPRLLRLNKNARFMYVFDWNSRVLCLANIGGEILDSRALVFPEKCTPPAFSIIVLEGLTSLRRTRPVEQERMLGFGLALPGLVDSSRETLLYSVELGWRDVDVRYLFGEMFGQNVFLERSGNMLALGECVYGAASGHKHAMLVLLEHEGIGVSAVIRGACQHGSNYMFGELGHIKLPSKVLCSCGQQGCLEAVVRDHLMRNGDVLDDVVSEYISLGVSTAVNLADPDIVLLSGGLVRDLTKPQERGLIARIRSKVTNERSRVLNVQIIKEERSMGIKGMSAHIFSRLFMTS